MKQIPLLLLMSVMLLACKKDDNKPNTNPFVGAWAGTYTGAQDNGTWEANIDADGQAIGTIKSVVFSQTFQLNGAVDLNGSITMAIGSSSIGGTFGGTLKSDNTASGVWNTGSMSGTWTGSKK